MVDIGEIDEACASSDEQRSRVQSPGNRAACEQARKLLREFVSSPARQDSIFYEIAKPYSDVAGEKEVRTTN